MQGELLVVLPLLLLLFTAGLGHGNMGQGCAGTCSQAALCHSCAKLTRLTLTEGSDSAVTVAMWEESWPWGLHPWGQVQNLPYIPRLQTTVIRLLSLFRG